MVSVGCGTGSEASVDDSLPIPNVTEAMVDARFAQLRSQLPLSDSLFLTDGSIGRDELEAAVGRSAACIAGVAGPLEATHDVVVDTREPQWSVDGLYLDLPYRIGFPSGETEADFEAIDDVERAIAACLASHSDVAAELYRLQQIPTGSERQDAAESLLACLGAGWSTYNANPTPEGDQCLVTHSALFEAIPNDL